MSAEATQENLPSRVGGYDVLFRVETGVDASMLVARGAEPGALPVTIKRIAPSVTQGKDIGAFLGRARAAVALSHPNLATVRDVLQEADAVSVVTEYLDGENVTTLLRRLVVENKSLGFGLAAYVVAEAAAGIQAGHAADMLHQHLTPNDIIVLHDGRVKVLDIGIARAIADLSENQRISEKELPYASPERCKGEPVDRRSDVYSLGTVLWELMTGVSPFERDDQAATLRAIMSEDPRLPPMSVLRNLPSELSDIALRAIDRDPGSRYPSAGALHDALTAFVRAVPMGGALPSASLSILMQNIFAKRIRNNARLLRRAETRGGNTSSASIPPPSIPPPPAFLDSNDLQRPTVDAFTPGLPTPPNDFPVAVVPSKPLPLAVPDAAPTDPTDLAETPVADLPTVVEASASEPTMLAATPVRDPDAAPLMEPLPGDPSSEDRPSPLPDLSEPTSFSDDEPGEGSLLLPGVTRGRWLVPAIAAGALLVLLLGWLAFSSGSSRPSAAAVSSSEPSEPHEPSPPPTTSERAIPPPAPAASASQTTLRIDSVPPKATILLDGVSVGTSPMDVKVRRGSQPVVIELRRPGYEPWRESVVPDVDQKLRLSLEPVASARGATAPQATPSPPFPAAATSGLAAPKPKPSASANANPYHRFD
jgi:serine/threonine-protein kinase